MQYPDFKPSERLTSTQGNKLNQLKQTDKIEQANFVNKETSRERTVPYNKPRFSGVVDLLIIIIINNA